MTATVDDPVASFLAKFERPQEWSQVLRGVPVFVTHERTETQPAADGKSPQKKDIKVDEARLHKIAANMQRLVKSGTPIRFQEGHTKLPVTGHDQSQQPRTLSWGINPRVGRWGPEQKLGILLDEFIPHDTAAAVKTFPFRSAEFYDQGDEITAVALLRTDPFLDMGAIAYGADSRLGPRVAYDPRHRTLTCYWKHEPEMYAMPLEPDKKPPQSPHPAAAGAKPGDEDMRQKITCAPEQMPAHQYMLDNFDKHLAHHMKGSQYMAGAPGAAPGAAPMAAPSATNGMPAPALPPDKKDDDKMPYQKQQELTQYEKVLTDRIAALEQQARDSERHVHYSKTADQLILDRCPINKDEFVGQMMKANPSAEQFESMVTLYRQTAVKNSAPTGLAFVATAPVPYSRQEQPAGVPTAEQSERITQYQKDRNLWGISGYNEAKKAIMGS